MVHSGKHAPVKVENTPHPLYTSLRKQHCAQRDEVSNLAPLQTGINARSFAFDPTGVVVY